MPWYMTQATVSRETVQSLLSKPEDRSVAIARLMEAHGAKLHHMFWAMGDHDIVSIAEAPNDEAVLAALMTVAAGGAASNIKTTKLFPVSETLDVLRQAGAKSGSYSPPGG